MAQHEPFSAGGLGSSVILGLSQDDNWKLNVGSDPENDIMTGKSFRPEVPAARIRAGFK